MRLKTDAAMGNSCYREIRSPHMLEADTFQELFVASKRRYVPEIRVAGIGEAQQLNQSDEANC